MKYFSEIFYSWPQQMFEERVDERDIDRAIEILENLPDPFTKEDLTNRYKVMMEGYKAIVKVLMEKPNAEQLELIVESNEKGCGRNS